MKRLLILIALLLSGCTSMIEAYSLKYDTNEYLLITYIRNSAGLSKNTCNDQTSSKNNANDIALKTSFFVNFTQYSASNSDVKTAAIELNNISIGLTAQYNNGRQVSPTFCKLKFENIETNAETIQKTIGKKPK